MLCDIATKSACELAPSPRTGVCHPRPLSRRCLVPEASWSPSAWVLGLGRAGSAGPHLLEGSMSIRSGVASPLPASGRRRLLLWALQPGPSQGGTAGVLSRVLPRGGTAGVLSSDTGQETLGPARLGQAEAGSTVVAEQRLARCTVGSCPAALGGAGPSM